MPPPHGHIAHAQKQHLHKARISRAALNLLHSQFHIGRGNDNRSPQTRVPIQPFLGDPIIKSTGKGNRLILIHDQLNAIERVENGQIRPHSIKDGAGQILQT